jgi:cobalamin biosynthesis protein CobD/CbiB
VNISHVSCCQCIIIRMTYVFTIMGAEQAYDELRDIIRGIEERGDLLYAGQCKAQYVARRDLDAVARLRNFPEVFTLFK